MTDFRLFAQAVYAQLPECADANLDDIEADIENYVRNTRSDVETATRIVRKNYVEDIFSDQRPLVTDIHSGYQLGGGSSNADVSEYHSLDSLFRQLHIRRSNLPDRVNENADFADNVPCEKVDRDRSKDAGIADKTDAAEYNLIDDYIRFLFRQYLEEQGLSTETKKEQIIALKNRFGTKKKPVYKDDLIADVVDASPTYVSEFGWGENGTVVNTAREAREGDISDSVRQTVRQRDGYECVRCGRAESETQLEIHHIIPAASGGDHTVDNLATLCRDCHQQAHGGTGMGTTDTAYNTKEEFWEEWIQNPSSP